MNVEIELKKLLENNGYISKKRKVALYGLCIQAKEDQ